jgi:hypothetical protein
MDGEGAAAWMVKERRRGGADGEEVAVLLPSGARRR